MTTRYRKSEKVHVKKFEFKTFKLKNFPESRTPRILCTLIFNSLQLNPHVCVSSRVMDDKMLSCVRGYQYSIWNSYIGEMVCCESG